MAASHMLVSITTTVRPQFLLALDVVQKFYGTMNAGGLEALPLKVSVLISCTVRLAICNERNLKHLRVSTVLWCSG